MVTLRDFVAGVKRAADQLYPSLVGEPFPSIVQFPRASFAVGLEHGFFREHSAKFAVSLGGIGRWNQTGLTK